jgi:hypothetical protein
LAAQKGGRRGGGLETTLTLGDCGGGLGEQRKRQTPLACAARMPVPSGRPGSVWHVGCHDPCLTRRRQFPRPLPDATASLALVLVSGLIEACGDLRRRRPSVSVMAVGADGQEPGRPAGARGWGWAGRAMPIAPPVLDDRRLCPGGVVVGLAQPLDRGGKPLRCKARVTSGRCSPVCRSSR